MGRQSPEEALGALFSALTPKQKATLVEMAEALLREVHSEVNPKSDICTQAFANEFQDRLSLYHARNDEPLNKKTFEYAFVKASMAAGRKAVIDDSPVNPGTDVVVDGTCFSLKTEASHEIRNETITISKLMEARWIRECRTGSDFVRGTKAKIYTHLKQYERIIMLRAFAVSEPKRGFRYDLAEIPLDLLKRINSLRADDFSPRTPNGTSNAGIYDGEAKLFALRLDGSVEKVTISGLRVDKCITHGSWTVFLKDTD